MEPRSFLLEGFGRWIFLACLATFAVHLSGCSPAKTGSTSTSGSEETESNVSAPTADEVLAKMVAVYRVANSYVDQATYFRSRARRDEKVIRPRPIHEMSLALSKPNKLRFMTKQVYPRSARNVSFDVASDGTVIRSSAGGLVGQIHEVSTPETLTVENFIPEPNIREAALRVSLENIYPQLSIMLTDGDITKVFPKAEKTELIEDDKLGGRLCHRVALTSADGTRVLWIDEETSLLLRMELPIDSQMSELDPEGVFSQYSIWIDYNQVALDTEIVEDVFAMSIPEGVRRVSSLVEPPPPAPSDKLGQPVGEFSFTTLADKKITPATHEGKVVVLDFWLNTCPGCKSQTPLLEEIYQQLKDNDKFVVYGVNANLKKHNLSDQTIENLFESWGASFPVLRDLEETSDFQMGIRRYPHMTIVGPDGRVQYDEYGEHTEAEPLLEILQKVLEGEDPASEAVAEHQRLVEQYEKALEEATIEQVESEDSTESESES